MSAALRRVFPYAFWLCVLILAVLSWLPGEDLPRTGLAGRLEHFIAYAGTSLMGGLAWPTRHHALMLVGGLAAFAAVMELGQFFVPGRHPSVWDFLASSAGGLATAVVLRLIAARNRPA